MAFASGVDSGATAILGTGNTVPSDLMDLLMVDAIQPGSAPGYQTCKTILVSHPLGLKMTEGPIKLAQSQKREINIPDAPDDLKEAFETEWDKIGGTGADLIIRSTATLARAYGIASLIIGGGGKPNEPLDLDKVSGEDLFFNVLDPLNTAGSLVLNQSPNSPRFMRPEQVRADGVTYHPSRCVVLMNEQPVYIQWTDSSFGFVGRSVYQRALYPLKSYIQSMITDNQVTEKAALLVAKLKTPGSTIDQRTRGWFSFKRDTIKGARTGNVVSIGTDESIEAIDLKNLKDAAEFARNNILKNIACAADMPASLINMETLAEGFGEGSEDAKNIARFIEGIRGDLALIYNAMDNIVMYRAWDKAFYESIQRKYPEVYEGVDYLTAFTAWKNAFKAKWPNLLQEPESDIAKGENETMKGAIGIYEVLAPNLDPVNRAALAVWLADIANSRKTLFSSPIEIDQELLEQYEPPAAEEPENMPESGRD